MYKAQKDCLYSCVWVFTWISMLIASPVKVNLEDHCNSTIPLALSGLVQIGNWTKLPTDGSSCTLVYKAFSPYHHGDRPERVHVTILSMSLPGQSPPCNESRLDIIDSDGSTYLSGDQGICGKKVHHSRFDSTNQRVYIRVTSSNSSYHGALKVLVSAFNENICDTKKEFSCDNGRCVDESLSCNGYNDCGDNSDEKDGCFFTTTYIILIVVGATLITIFMVFIMVIAIRRRWRTGWGAGPNPSIFSINEEIRPLSKKHKQDSYGAMVEQ